ncbi:hypothetical protein IAD21_01868 [Abditibacteriota bacterium]|nr:hypothetical protein IAD21_01868 [Abditibacteriota bacterium]
MKTSPLLLGALLLLPCAAHAEGSASCAAFNALVAKTYNFDVSHLSGAQGQAREKQLDHFWGTVKTNKAKYLPCLRAKVGEAKANAYFRFDGSNLLVSLDPSLDSKRLQVAVYTNTPLPLDLLVTARWVGTLTLRGTEGFDVSKAAKRALDDEEVAFLPPTAEYREDGLSHFDAARLLWASQSEERATPQLFALANNPKYVQREAALSLLLDQATPAAHDLVLKLDQKGLSADAVAAIDKFLHDPGDVVPRDKPKITRAQFLRAFNDLLKGDSHPFFALVSDVSDGERDAAAVLLPTDLPILRRVRRRFLVGCNQHSLNYYQDFTGIIFAVMQKDSAIPKA